MAILRRDAVDKSILIIFPNIFIPVLLYLVGKYIGEVYHSEKIRTFFLFFIAFSFSLIPIISILLQVKESGFVGGVRDMYLLWDKKYEITATGLGSYLVLNMASIALVIVKGKTKLEKKLTFCIIILFILSIFCAIRLGSRTQLAITIFLLVLVYLTNFSKRSVGRKLSIICLIAIPFFYFYKKMNTDSPVLLYFAGRMDRQEVGINTAGGRSQRWALSLESIFTDPFGWEFNRFGYIHNLWLDVARVSGIIPLILLIFFTLGSSILLLRTLKILKKSLFLKTYILVFFVGMMMQFSVEPVMEGMFLLFVLYCLFVGYLSGIVGQYQSVQNRITKYVSSG